KAEGALEVEPYCFVNDLGRETIAGVGDLVHPRWATRPPRTPQAQSAVTMPIEVQARRIDVIVVYKVDRLSRSLADFAKLVETFDAHGVSFVSVTQSFNTTTSMGRLTLNVLLSFAQFEREVTG